MALDLHSIERRVADIEGSLEKRTELLRAAVSEAVKEAMPSSLLSDEQYRWVELAIQREAQSIAFRKAVIEKTLTGLIWAALGGLGTLVWAVGKEFFAAHGWK